MGIINEKQELIRTKKQKEKGEIMAWYNPLSWPRAAGEALGEHVIYPALTKTGLMTDDDIINSPTINYMAEKDELLKRTNIVTTVTSMGLDATNTIGEKIGEEVYEALIDAGVSNDQILEAYENSPVLTKIAETGEYLQTDTDRAAEVIWRSLAEKGPGSIFAIPGDIADAIDTYLVDMYDGSAGDWTREQWICRVHEAQDALGIEKLEIRNEQEAMLSGLYGEIPAMATLFVGNGAGLAKLGGKFPKVAKTLAVVAPVAKVGLTGTVVTAQGLSEQVDFHENRLDTYLIEQLGVDPNEFEGMELEDKIKLLETKQTEAQEKEVNTYLKEKFDFTDKDLDELKLEERIMLYQLGQLADNPDPEAELKKEPVLKELPKEAPKATEEDPELIGAELAGISGAVAGGGAIAKAVPSVTAKAKTDTVKPEQKSMLPAFMTSSLKDMSGQELKTEIATAKDFAKDNSVSLSFTFNACSMLATGLSWFVGDDNSWVKSLRSSSLESAKESLSQFNVAASGEEPEVKNKVTIKDPTVHEPRIDTYNPMAPYALAG
jgi:hypothetical protein